MNPRRITVLALVLAAIGSPAILFADGQLKDFDAAKAVAVIGDYCARCHDWAADYGSIMGSGKVAPGKPGDSDLVMVIESGYMPPSGPAVGPAELGLIRGWIEAGAPAPGAAAAVPGAPVDVASGATALGGAPGLPSGSGGFLGFPSKAAYHRAAGWTSSGLLLAAGVVGAVRAWDLMSAGHEYRDLLGIDEETMSPVCDDYISSLWSDGQALRWTHVGLLVAGESIYLGNAFTGISMLSPRHDGPPNRSDLHRWAFYGHAGLMAAEITLGFLTSDALSRGDHELVSHLGVAHAAVGLAVPVLMIASGVVIGR